MSGSTSTNSPKSPSTSDDYEGRAEIERAWRSGLAPDPKLRISQWADRHRFLSPRASAEPGRYRTARAPYMRSVMDALAPANPARRVVFMKSAQVGASEGGNNWVGFVIHHAPGPMLAVQPTVDLAKRYSKQRIEPLIDSSPELRRKVRPSRSKDAGNTISVKEFPGGILIMTGANSAVGLRSMPARYVFLDEVDAYPGDVDGEGDPIVLAEDRMQTFGRAAKIYLVSTPTIKGQSRIEREYLASDQRRFFVPCPHCDSKQWLKFEQLRWARGAPETAAYMCEDCGESIEERHKAWMLANGEWWATSTAEDPGTVGFHISALYSPPGWLSWVEMARQWETAQKAQDKQAAVKAFKNTKLGETFAEEIEQVDWERLYERREHWKPGTLPAGVSVLMAAVDVQASPARLELHLWGFGEGIESWAIERRVIYGRADNPETWKGIEAALDETWTHASGAELRIDVLAVDTGDQATAVYGWVSQQNQSRVYAVKGRGGYDLNAPVASPTNIAFGPRRRAVRLRSVSVDVFKAEFYRNLRLTQRTDEEGGGHPPGFVHIPDHLDAEFCRQLTAEHRIKTKSGRFVWKKDHGGNEALDCWIYSRAALWTMGVAAWKPARWAALRERRGLDLTQEEVPAAAPVARPVPPPRPQARRAVRRSSYMD